MYAFSGTVQYPANNPQITKAENIAIPIPPWPLLHLHPIHRTLLDPHSPPRNPHQPHKIQPHLPHHPRMLLRSAQTIVPGFATHAHTPQLPSQSRIEFIQPLFRPFNTRAHRCWGETLLECADGVADEGEVDVGELEDVVAEVAFEENGAGSEGD